MTKVNLLVIGLGKLGLPLCGVLAESGHQVYGVDKSEELVQSLNSQKFFSSEPNLMNKVLRGYKPGARAEGGKQNNMT